MNDTKLIELLATFTKKEMKDFGKFIVSPFHLTGVKVNHIALKKFFGILKKYHPGFESRNLQKDIIFKLLYPGKMYKDETMRQLMKTLTKLGMEFITYLEIKEDKFHNRSCLLRSLDKRKLDKMFITNQKQAEAEIESADKNSDYYYRKQLLATIVNNFCVFRHKIQELYDPQKSADYFFKFFFAEALQYYRNLILHESFQNKKHEFTFYKEVSEYLKQNMKYINENFLISIYYYQLLVNVEDNDNNFAELKKLSKTYFNSLTDSNKQAMYSNLSGYCIIKIKKGFTVFRKEKFELDKELLQSGAYKKWGYLPMNDFLSSLTNSIYLKEYEWAERFISTYSAWLDPEHSSFAINYVRAELEFSRGNYGKTLEYLSRVTVEYSYDRFNMKILTLKTYYETGNWDGIMYLVDSMKHLSKQDKLLTEQQRQFSSRLVRYIQKLALIRIESGFNKIGEFIDELKSAPYFRHKEWFLQKLGELEIANLKK